MASELIERLYAQARITPISAPYKVKTVTKLDDGGLNVEFASGETATIAADDELIQAFVVYTLLEAL